MVLLRVTRTANTANKRETIKFQLKLAAIVMTDLADSVVMCTPVVVSF